MSRPPMTEDQRTVVVALLANAIRNDRRNQLRVRRADEAGGLARALGARGHSDASRQYIRGMCDLLTVLFDGGRTLADACLAEAEEAANG